MPVVVAANPKGGSGKTTLMLTLALSYAALGHRVAVVDADPNQIIANWVAHRVAQGRSVPFTLAETPAESSLVRVIEDQAARQDLVLIDLEGTASRMTSRAFARAHLVLVPLMPSAMDAGLAGQAVELIREEGEALQREIPFRLVISRAPAAVATRSLTRILAGIGEAGLPLLGQELRERAAFREIFEFGATFEELRGQTSNLDAAISNAHAVAEAVAQTLVDLYPGDDRSGGEGEAA